MKAHMKYLSYVLRHKWFVFLAGLRTGAPLWRLIVHDWSKFLPCEWFAYTRYFYGESTTPNPAYYAGEGWRGWFRQEWEERRAAAFDRAWLHHQHANPHHWQHWVLREDDGGTKALEMPERFVREMVADWMGAGRAMGHGNDALPWYLRNRGKMVLHPETEELVEHLLGMHRL